MKMIVEIWSDVVCPFCYIGKRKLEKALSLFENREHVELVWRSYQLYPDAKTQPDKTIYEFMAEKHGITVEQIKDEYKFINDMAAEVGLKYQLDKAILVNTRNAHRLLQMAKREKKDNIAEEILFKSYFIDNKNIDDTEVLERVAEEIGFDKLRFNSELLSLQNDEGIDSDIYQSRQIGVRGVPFFLINNSISISGAQDVSVFIDGLNKGWDQIKS
jgi:predicted DsbA family dithiol-disulfide isomerase